LTALISLQQKKNNLSRWQRGCGCAGQTRRADTPVPGGRIGPSFASIADGGNLQARYYWLHHSAVSATVWEIVILLKLMELVGRGFSRPKSVLRHSGQT
jgi:hypothetical protein